MYNNLKVLQINTGRSRAAHGLAMETANTNNADILVTSEPNKALIKQSKWLKDTRGDAALM